MRLCVAIAAGGVVVSHAHAAEVTHFIGPPGVCVMPMAVSDDGITVVGKWLDRNGELSRVLERDSGAARWELRDPRATVHVMEDAGPGKLVGISRDGRAATGRVDAYMPAASQSGSRTASPVSLPDTAELEPERSRIAAISGDGSVMAGWTSNAARGHWRINATVWLDGNRVDLPRVGNYFPSAGWAQGVSPNGRHIVGVIRSPQRTPFSVMWTGPREDGTWTTRILEDADETLRGAFAVSDDGGAALGRSAQSVWRWTSDDGVEKLFDAPSGFWRVDVHSQCDGLNVIVGEFRGGANDSEGFIWTPQTGVVLFDAFADSLKLDLQCSQPIPRWVSGDGSIIVGEGLAADGRIIGWMIRVDPLCLQATMFASSAGGGDFFDLLALVAAGDVRADIAGSSDPRRPTRHLPDGRTDLTDLMLLLEWRLNGCL